MPITVKYTAICDGCGAVMLDRNVSLDELEDGIEVDPEVVFTQREEKELVFHSRDCGYQWLRSQGQHSEAEEFKNAAWTATA